MKIVAISGVQGYQAVLSYGAFYCPQMGAQLLRHLFFSSSSQRISTNFQTESLV